MALLPPYKAPQAHPGRADEVWKVGKLTFRADFDSANLKLAQPGTNPSEYQLWTRKDCEGTAHERGTRSWFFYGVSGYQQGDFVVMTIMNLNKQGRLYSQDYRPWLWCVGMNEWQPISNKVTYKRHGEDFQLRFSHKFSSLAGETFFAFAPPFSYEENQGMLDHLSDLFLTQPTMVAHVPGKQQQQRQDEDLVSHTQKGSISGIFPAATCEAHGQEVAAIIVSGSENTAMEDTPTKNSELLDTTATVGQQQQCLELSAQGHICSAPNKQASSFKKCGSSGFKSRQTTVLQSVQTADIYFHRQTIAASVQGRSVELITITHMGGAPCGRTGSQTADDHENGLCNDAVAQSFGNRKVFFVSARVHPGETPSSHMFNGMLEFLLRTDDARAAALRKMFVFKLVPMVNPDGVAAGYYRTDTLGQNLNRHYLGNPDKALQPAVWAIKNQLMQYAAQGVLAFYLDLHAHANKQGVFIYGNALEGQQALLSLAYAKLVALNNPMFDFANCNFTEKNMSRADKEGMSKEGAARVALFRETGLTHLYTVEANYNTIAEPNIVPPAAGEHSGRASPGSGRRTAPKFTVPVLQSVGRAFLIASLDLDACNPWTRMPNSDFRTVEGLKSWLLSVSQASNDTRASHLPSIADTTLQSLREMAKLQPRRTSRQAKVSRRTSESTSHGLAKRMSNNVSGKSHTTFVGSPHHPDQPVKMSSAPMRTMPARCTSLIPTYCSRLPSLLPSTTTKDFHMQSEYTTEQTNNTKKARLIQRFSSLPARHVDAPVKLHMIDMNRTAPPSRIPRPPSLLPDIRHAPPGSASVHSLPTSASSYDSRSGEQHHCCSVGSDHDSTVQRRQVCNRNDTSECHDNSPEILSSSNSEGDKGVNHCRLSAPESPWAAEMHGGITVESALTAAEGWKHEWKQLLHPQQQQIVSPVRQSHIQKLVLAALPSHVSSPETGASCPGPLSTFAGVTASSKEPLVEELRVKGQTAAYRISPAHRRHASGVL